MTKYQFCIRFDKVDVNSSASKAVLDCHKIFAAHGYHDLTLTVDDNADKKSYYYILLKRIIRLFLQIKRNALVGIQYPLLSINSVFKYFIKIARWKGAKFFCIVHDLESLRTGGKDEQYINNEVSNLNQYDLLIVHNRAMMAWLRRAGVTRPMLSLELFDYLAPNEALTNSGIKKTTVVYAGNLIKSTFIYKLPAFQNVDFKVYGPGFLQQIAAHQSVKWEGVFSPDDVVKKMQGTYGLIWDGTQIDACDDILGNYLSYNNPHKASLYLAAGLPLIAPRKSALASFIHAHNIGLLIDTLEDIELAIEAASSIYPLFRNNVLKIRTKIINGDFFSKALNQVEKELQLI